MHFRILHIFLENNPIKYGKPSLELFDKNTNFTREKWPLRSRYYLCPDKLGDLATSESFRRYWSWYQFAYSPLGVRNVLSPAIIQPDFRFFNPFNYMLKYDNTPITETLRKYWNDEKNPISTEEGQPRLLIVAVDVQDATTVTFDSYINKKYKQRMTIYGDEDKATHVIEYKDGIKMEHLLATMSSHLRYKFPELKVTTLENEQIKEGGQPRPFMDGFYLSNTPLREVIQAHKKYWEEKDIEKLKEDVPSLDIIIGDLYPTMEKGTPEDPDSIQNRVQNVLYHDKSKYDEKATIMVSDYIGISKILWNHLKDKGMSEEELKIIKKEINGTIKSKGRKGAPRKFEDLVYNRFTINNLLRIEYGNGQQINESNDINGKAFEVSSRTIRDLINQGIEDTLKYETELSLLD